MSHVHDTRPVRFAHHRFVSQEAQPILYWSVGVLRPALNVYIMSWCEYVAFDVVMWSIV
jgi:hypothetical protein